jgi:hypothetical protein
MCGNLQIQLAPTRIRWGVSPRLPSPGAGCFAACTLNQTRGQHWSPHAPRIQFPCVGDKPPELELLQAFVGHTYATVLSVHTRCSTWEDGNNHEPVTPPSDASALAMLASFASCLLGLFPSKRLGGGGTQGKFTIGQWFWDRPHDGVRPLFQLPNSATEHAPRR